MADHRRPQDHHRPPRLRRLLHPRALPGHRRLRGAAQGADHDPRGGGRRGGHGQPAGPRRRRVPGRAQVVDAAQEPGDLPGGQRRRERAGHLQGPPADRARPPPDHRGGAHRRLRPAGHAGLHLPAGASSPSGSSACRRRCNEAYAHGAVGRGHLRLRLLARHGRPPRRRRLHLRRGDGAARVARGQARLPADQAPVLPGRHRPLRRAHRGQQRRDHVQHALDRHQRRRGLRRPRRGPLDGHPAVRPGRPRATTRATTRSRWSRPPSATSSTTPRSAAASPTATSCKAFIPGGVSAPWFGPDQVDLPLGQDEVGEAGSMLGLRLGRGHGLEHTCTVRAAWRITKFFSRESCGQCTPCREGSGWLERIMYRIENGGGREEDLDLLLDACDNISPGLAWPPQQTTICVLGPSIPSVHRLGASRCSATSSSCTSRKGGALCLTGRGTTWLSVEAPAGVIHHPRRPRGHGDARARC